jgi:hypothetical protein
MTKREIIDSLYKAILMVLYRQKGFVLLPTIQVVVSKSIPTTIFEKVLAAMEAQGYVFKREPHFFCITESGVQKLNTIQALSYKKVA